MTGPAPARAGRRRLAGVCLGLAVGAVASWWSAGLVWFSATVPTAARGTVPVAVTGSQVEPVPTAVALLALAAVAASVALTGVWRRLLGVVLVVAAVAGGWAVITDAVARPTAQRVADLAGVSLLPGGPTAAVTATAAPLLAVFGALFVLVAGLVLVLREKGMPGMGARYGAPARRRAPADPDRAAWDALDAGDDPTAPGAGSADTR